MKRRIVVAIAVGGLISFSPVLLAALHMQHLVDYLAAPGIIAIMLIWGRHGPAPVPDIMVEGIVLGSNAIIYGLVAFGILCCLGRAKAASHRPTDAMDA